MSRRLSLAESWLMVATLAVCGTLGLGAVVHTEIAIAEAARWALECGR